MFQVPRYASLTCCLALTHLWNLSVKIVEMKKIMELKIHGLVSSLPISGEKRNLLKQATAADKTLQMVHVFIAKRWPRYKSDTPISTRQYWPIRDELHVVEGLVFRGEKLVIPASRRSEMLTKLHESHLRMEKCKARARSIMYWPGMGQDIEENHIKMSHLCQIACQPPPTTHPS